MRGVKNGPSPEWLQRRLRAIGLRPINALVDITNFITYDRGRPLHVFDAAKVKGDLVVRRARDGETVLALDGKTYTLDPEICVIADDNGVESIAGIMGGEASGCTEATTDVLIESALWEPLNVAATGRKLGIHSDARHRFERGVDPAFMLPGLELATRMVLDLCGGTPTEIVVAGEVPEPQMVIDFPVAEIKRLAGIDPSISDVTAILEALGFASQAAPHDRHDHRGGADLAAGRDDEGRPRRGGGADHRRRPRARRRRCRALPGVLKPVLTPIQLRTRRAQARARRPRPGRGGDLVVHLASRRRKPSAAASRSSSLANPIAADMSDMRPSLLPGLIAAAQRNADRGYRRSRAVRGRADLSRRPSRGSGHRREPASAAAPRASPAAAATGRRRPRRSASSTPRPMRSPPSMRSACRPTRCRSSPRRRPGSTPAARATIRQGPKTIIGWFGEFHPTTLAALDVDGPLAGFELILDAIPLPTRQGDQDQAAARRCPTSSRSAATSPSSSTARSRRRRWCAPPRAPTRS